MGTDEQTLTVAELCQRWKVNRVTVWRMRKDDPDFPSPVAVRGRIVRFSASSIAEYDAKRQSRK